MFSSFKPNQYDDNIEEKNIYMSLGQNFLLVDLQTLRL